MDTSSNSLPRTSFSGMVKVTGSSVNPKVSLSHLIGNSTLRAAIGTGIKEPTFSENFDSTFALGNPDLDPEQSISWEVGWDWHSPEKKLQTSNPHL